MTQMETNSKTVPPRAGRSVLGIGIPVLPEVKSFYRLPKYRPFENSTGYLLLEVIPQTFGSLYFFTFLKYLLQFLKHLLGFLWPF